MRDARTSMTEARRREEVGDLHGAIRSYGKALALQEEAGGGADPALHNRIGDLHLRCGKTPQAVECCEKAVDGYEDQQLFSNAIALCKRILHNAAQHARQAPWRRDARGSVTDGRV